MKAKQIAGTAALIILQTAVFVAFILCSNAVQQRFPVRYMPSVREELRFYMDMEAVLTDMYSVALHAASVIAFF